jgi:uncharacterized protein (TIGR03435 family)
MRHVVSVLIGMAALVVGAVQAQTEPAAGTPLEFEVASIKPNESMSGGMSLNRVPGGGFNCSNVTLRMLITFAYDIRDHQLSGGPGWIDTDRYDITARLDHDSAAAEPQGFSDASSARLRARVRALLADRFKLAVRSETKEMPVYALVVAKNGPHLEEWKTGVGPQIRGQAGLLTCKKVSMKMFAERVLAQRLGRAVLDKTGLGGDFDFEVKYAEEGPPAKPGVDPAGGAPAASEPSGPTFLIAMQEQLGLKLESQKGPVEFFIVTHAEKASAN